MISRVGGVRGELGIQDLSRVGDRTELGRTGRHVVVDAGFAVAAHQGDVDADVRVGVRLYLDNVGVLDHGVGTDGRNGTGHRGIDGGTLHGADVEGAGLGSSFPRRP